MKNRQVWPAIVALLLVPVFYVGSFGPACWATAQPMSDRYQPPGWMVVYFPIGMVHHRYQTTWHGKLLRKWAMLGAPKRTMVGVQMNFTGTDTIAWGCY